MAKTPGKRQLSSEMKRELIIKKSMELFKEYGYEKITISDICTECSINVGTLYHHFGSKFGILQAISAKMSVSGILSENISEKACNPYESLMKFFIDYAARWKELGTDLSMQIYRNFAKIYIDPKTSATRESDALKELQLFIKEAQKKGSFDQSVDPSETAYMFILLGRGIVFDWCLQNNIYDLSEKSLEVMKRIVKSFII